MDRQVWHVLALIQMIRRYCAKDTILTGTLSYKTTLDHRSTGTCLSECHLVYNGILFYHSTALDTEAISCRSVIFYDSTTAFEADSL